MDSFTEFLVTPVSVTFNPTIIGALTLLVLFLAHSRGHAAARAGCFRQFMDDFCDTSDENERLVETNANLLARYHQAKQQHLQDLRELAIPPRSAPDDVDEEDYAEPTPACVDDELEGLLE